MELKGGEKKAKYNKMALNAYALSIFNSLNKKYIDSVSSGM